MTRGRGPLVPVLEAYGQARGDQGDERWAQDAAATMALEHLSPGAIVTELEEALPLVRESGEGPAALYGPAREWARARIADGTEQGRALVDSTPDSTWRDVPVVGSVAAALISLVMLVVTLVKDGLRTDYTWGLVLLPLAAGIAVTAGITVWEKLLLRRSRTVAALGALGVLVVGIGLITALVLSGAPLGEASTLRLLGLAVGYALLAGLLERSLPQTRQRSQEAQDDEAWAAQLAGTLRLRMDLDEDRVREIVREARAHAASADTTLAEEFGPPQAYASRFERDRAAGRRRAAWVQTALVPVVAVLALGDLVGGGEVSWFYLALFVLAVANALYAWRTVRGQEPPRS